MIAALALGITAGFLARAVFGGTEPGVLVALIAGFAGSVIGFLVTHDLLRIHEMRLFAPEGLLPASVGAQDSAARG
ncbi:MAG: hypothetical protein M3376_08205 [Actinomycetota bacterium]|nr:hypothetical protein [Actinomycetota bacterium]